MWCAGPHVTLSNLYSTNNSCPQLMNSSGHARKESNLYDRLSLRIEHDENHDQESIRNDEGDNKNSSLMKKKKCCSLWTYYGLLSCYSFSLNTYVECSWSNCPLYYVIKLLQSHWGNPLINGTVRHRILEFSALRTKKIHKIPVYGELRPCTVQLLTINSPTGIFMLNVIIYGINRNQWKGPTTK